MKVHKRRYMLFIFQQTEDADKTFKCIEDCTNAIYGLKEFSFDAKIRGSYADEDHMREINKVDLAKMMLIDGCFILELLLRYHQYSLNMALKNQSTDPIFNNAWMIPALRHDLTLLENQIPFFILTILYDTIRPHIVNYSAPKSVTNLALKFFQPMNHKAIKEDMVDSADCKHLLHLLHKFFLPSLDSTVTNHQVRPSGYGHISINLTVELGSQNQCISTVQTTSHLPNPTSAGSKKNGFRYSASKLLEAGIEFKAGSMEDHLLDITFKNGVIRIPPVFIDEATDSLFRNLIAFEQCHLKSSHNITSYAILMKSLIRFKEDIKLLKKRNIIINSVEDNYLGHFERILEQVNTMDFCFGELCEDVNAYSKSWFHWHKHKVFWTVRFQRYIRLLITTYFSSPWSFMAFVAAMVVFSLTVTQTYYAIHPRK